MTTPDSDLDDLIHELRQIDYAGNAPLVAADEIDRLWDENERLTGLELVQGLLIDACGEALDHAVGTGNDKLASTLRSAISAALSPVVPWKEARDDR